MCPEAGQRRIPTSRARMERVEQDQSRAESAGMGTRDDRDQAASAKSKATEAQMQASNTDLSRPTGIPTLWGKRLHRPPYYRPCREKRRWVRARGSRDRQTETANTDPAGKEYRPRGETWYRDRGRQASRETFRALTWRLSMGFRGIPG
jgi:hypothetical protein